LLRDGAIVAAAQEERFTRKKHDSAFPQRAIEYCLGEADIGIDDVDCVAFYDKPFLKFERLMETYLAFAPMGFRSFRMAIPVWLREKLFQKDLIKRELKALSRGDDLGRKLIFSEHHLSHAASAFFPSPFENALVLTMDGVGEWATTSVGAGHRKPARGGARAALPALARPAVLGGHLLSRLQGQFGRVQGDGAGAVRRAQVRRRDPRQPDRHQARRHVPARSALFRVLPPACA